ncbi:Uncharacterised protein [Bordetella pertussis]|nr:Uncharacterised protein [Bordetella pertussis]
MAATSNGMSGESLRESILRASSACTMVRGAGAWAQVFGDASAPSTAMGMARRPPCPSASATEGSAAASEPAV